MGLNELLLKQIPLTISKKKILQYSMLKEKKY